MQKISSIHKFILEIQQILESQEEKATPIFDHGQPKVIEVTFSVTF